MWVGTPLAEATVAADVVLERLNRDVELQRRVTIAPRTSPSIACILCTATSCDVTFKPVTQETK